MRSLDRLTLAAAVLVVASIGACGGGERRPEEARPEGSTVDVGGVAYTVSLARQINPNIPPASDWYQGPDPKGDALLFAVFLQACNSGSEPRAAASRFRLVGPFDARLAPKRLDEDNVFAYEPRELDPAQCIPRKGSAAERGAPGAMLLFEMPRDIYGNRPFRLEISGPEGGERASVEVDV